MTFRTMEISSYDAFSIRRRRVHPVGIAIATLGALLVIVNYCQVRLAGESLADDLTHRWKPVMESVLFNDATIYVDAVDNKPPVFELLNLAAGATGHYILAWYIIITTSTFVTVYILFEWTATEFGSTDYAAGLAIVAAVLYIAGLTPAGGTGINARTPMLLGVVLAVWTDRPVISGVALAIAALCSQYAALGGPILHTGGYGMRVAAVSGDSS